MNKESSKEAKKMFNDLNIMIVINLDPVTPVILEDLYSELMGGQIPHWEFGFSSLLDLLAAWFERSWIEGEVVLVPELTQRLKEALPRRYIERKFELPVKCWLGSLHLSCATTVTKMVESKTNLKTREDGLRLVEKLEIPQTVKNMLVKMLDANRAERTFRQDRLHHEWK